MKTKKLLFSVISIILALVFLIPVTAFAENGPAKDYYAYICLYKDEDVYSIYDLYSKIDSVDGVVYDEATNTLTLTNVKKPDFQLECNMMGDDFKLQLVGENELNGISMWGDSWGSSLTITGNGSIIVNENKELRNAICINAELSEGKLNIQNGVTAKLYSQIVFSTVIYISMSDNSDKNSAIVIDGNVAENYEISDSKDKIPKYKTVVAYSATAGWDYPEFTRENDTTIYIGDELYDDDTFELTGMVNMYKVEYCKQLDKYLATPVEGMTNIDPTEKGFTAKNSYIENTVLVDSEHQYNYSYFKSKSGTAILVDIDFDGTAFIGNLVTIDGYGTFVTRGEDIDYFDELEKYVESYQPAYFYSINTKSLTITPSGVKYGDCNNDNGINAKDVLILKQHLAKWTVDINMTNADCNGDSAVNAKDLLRLRQYLANWDVPLGSA